MGTTKFTGTLKYRRVDYINKKPLATDEWF